MIQFAAFDMDGTLVDAKSSWGFVHDHFGESNSEALALFLADQIDDAEFIRRDIRLWWKHAPSVTVDDLEEILDEVRLMPGARELFQGLHAHGVTTAIVSGGIDLLARRIARELGIDYVLANGFQVDGAGRLTGEGHIRVPIKQKEAALAAIQRQLGFSVGVTASVGNSEIDVGMFRRSQVGIAFQPEDELVRKGATVVVTERDLGLLLGPLGFAHEPGPPRRQGF